MPQSADRVVQADDHVDPGCTGGASSSSQPILSMPTSLTEMEHSSQRGSSLSATTTSPNNVQSGVHSIVQMTPEGHSLIVEVSSSSSEAANDATAESTFCLDALD